MIQKFFEIVQHAVHWETVSTRKITDNSLDFYDPRSAGREPTRADCIIVFGGLCARRVRRITDRAAPDRKYALKICGHRTRGGCDLANSLPNIAVRGIEELPWAPTTLGSR
jgi:hypothetical protein